MTDTRDLSVSECEALLRAGVVGRVALATPTGPHIVPINYSVVDDGIILRTSPYSLLGTYGRDTTLAFEIDQFDYTYKRGWSVLARGRAEAVRDQAEIERIRAIWPPHPWAGGVRSLYLKLRWTELTGRQIGGGWDPLQALTVHRAI